MPCASMWAPVLLAALPSMFGALGISEARSPLLAVLSANHPLCFWGETNYSRGTGSAVLCALFFDPRVSRIVCMMGPDMAEICIWDAHRLG